MSLFGDYIKETRGMGIVESEDGFATYLISGESCYIEDIYVSKNVRKANVATAMADDIKKVALEAGCKRLTGTVNTRFSDPTVAMKALLGYGFKITKNLGDLIYMEVEI